MRFLLRPAALLALLALLGTLVADPGAEAAQPLGFLFLPVPCFELPAPQKGLRPLDAGVTPSASGGLLSTAPDRAPPA
jgi:hypothetical protein